MKKDSPRQLLTKDGSVHITDEFYNTLISGAGAVLSVVGIVYLVWRALTTGQIWHVAGFIVYGFGLISVFTASALHHGVNGSPQTNHFLRQLDHFSIFIMIAGTVTPFCLILLRNPFGWTMLGLMWVLAIMGIVLKWFYPGIPRWIMVILYVGMGWLGIIIAKPLYEVIGSGVITALMVGGFFYTVGGLIYALEKPNPFPGKFGFHEIWHCFVLAGAASHFYIMVRYL